MCLFDMAAETRPISEPLEAAIPIAYQRLGLPVLLHVLLKVLLERELLATQRARVPNFQVLSLVVSMQTRQLVVLLITSLVPALELSLQHRLLSL